MKNYFLTLLALMLLLALSCEPARQSPTVPQSSTLAEVPTVDCIAHVSLVDGPSQQWAAQYAVID